MSSSENQPSSKYYSNKLLPGEPVIISTILEGYSISRDMLASDQEAHAMLNSLDHRVYFVVDIRELKLTFDDIISASNIGARGKDPLWHHPKIKKMIFVSENELVRKAGEGLNNLLFGYLNVLVFPTIEDALTYCRSNSSRYVFPG